MSSSLSNENSFGRVPDFGWINGKCPVTFDRGNCPLSMQSPLVVNSTVGSNGGSSSRMRQGFYWETSQCSKKNWNSASIRGGHDQLSNRGHHPQTTSEILQLLKDTYSVLKGRHDQQSVEEIGERYTNDIHRNGNKHSLSVSKGPQEPAGLHLNPQEPHWLHIFNRFRQNGMVKQPSRVRSTGKKFCTLCFQNGESRATFSNHTLKDDKGNARCPVLRSFVCEICKATGDKAHTKAYCPLMKGSKVPLAILLKNTPHDSCGRRRF